MKIVMILNQALSAGLAANTAAVLGISLGHTEPGVIGPDLLDRSQTCHPGITRQNIPVLVSDGKALKTIYEQTKRADDLAVISFNTIAHKSRDYEVYSEKLARTRTCDLEFSGLCIRGPEKKVSQLTGSMKLYG